MMQGIRVTIFPVRDLAAAKGFYQRLMGVEPYMDAPYYVAFRNGEQERA